VSIRDKNAEEDSHILDDFLFEYSTFTIPTSERVCMVGERYVFDMEKIIEDRCNEFADAFETTDQHSNSKAYYTLVFKNDVPTRINEIVQLGANTHSAYTVMPAAYGICKIKDGMEDTRLCITVPNPPATSVKEYYSNAKLTSQDIIEFISGVMDPLHELHSKGIVHGRINPDNIYINSTGKFIIGEFVSDLSGFSQPCFYETTHRGECHAYGKGKGVPADDYYALGVTIFQLVTKVDLQDVKDDEIISAKLHQGSFEYLNTLRMVRGEMRDFIMGLVVDDHSARWGYNDLKNLVQGRSYNISALRDKSYMSRPLLYNEHKHFSPKSLAYDLASNWEHATEYVKGPSIRNWLDISTENQAIIEALLELKDLIQHRGNNQLVFSKAEEMLIKTIMLLDYNGPVRCKGVIFYPDAVGNMLSFALHNQYNEMIKVLANVLYSGLFAYLDHVARVLQVEITNMKQIKEVYAKGEFIRMSGVMFGLRRAFYELNYTMSCRSEVFANKFISGAAELVMALEKSQIDIVRVVKDKDIMPFIAAKLGVSHDLIQRNLDALGAALANNAFIQLLFILAYAQKQCKIKSLPNVCGAFSDYFSRRLSEVIHSRSLREKYMKRIVNKAAEGNLYEIYNMVTNPEIISEDKRNYSTARRQASYIVEQLMHLRNRLKMDKKAYDMGLQFTVKSAFLMAMIVIIVSLFNNS
jgi:serine/threonine protein kinase